MVDALESTFATTAHVQGGLFSRDMCHASMAIAGHDIIYHLESTYTLFSTRNLTFRGK